MRKTILVTGASSGIGRATALRLADGGHTVFAAARRLNRLAQLARETSGTVIPVQLDVCDPVSVPKAVGAVAEVAPDGLDVLVNNAGYALTGPAETIATDEVRAQFETNVIGLFDVTRAFLPQMRRPTRRENRQHELAARGDLRSGERDLRRHQACHRGAFGRAADGAEAVRHQRCRVQPGFTSSEIDLTGHMATKVGALADYATLERELTTYLEAQTKAGAMPEIVAAWSPARVSRHAPRRATSRRRAMPWSWACSRGFPPGSPTASSCDSCELGPDRPPRADARRGQPECCSLGHARYVIATQPPEDRSASTQPVGSPCSAKRTNRERGQRVKIMPKTPFARFFLKGLITGRTFFFVSSLVAPHRVLRILQVPGDGTPAPMVLRMFGVRNGALALGLSHLHHFRAPRRFVAINVICDLIDALAFIDAGRRKEVSRTGATVTTAIAASAVAAGALTYANLPSDSKNDF